MVPWVRVLGTLAEYPGPILSTPMVVHNYLSFQYQGTRYSLLTPTGHQACTYIANTYIQANTHTNKINNNNNINI